MGFDTIITNGRVVTATDTYTSDVAITEGKIAAIGQGLPRDNARKIIDAAGKYVFPGGIDVHTHLDMPFGGTTSSDDFETGTRAAAFGGTTTLIDFAIQYKGQTLREALDNWMKKAEGKAVCDYSFHCIITDLADAQIDEMNALVREGVTSFKLFMAYPGVFMLDDASIFKALRATGQNGGLVCMHAENGGAIDVIVRQALAEGKKAPKYHALTRPTTAEAEATARAIALAEMAGSPVYIVHMSCNDALEKVREARDRGVPVYGETCPQYLYLSIENFDVPGFEGAKYVFTPPLREKWHQEKLWNGLKRDHLQVVSTDHCPFCFKEQKELGRDDFTKIPNGGPGIEHRMSLIYSGGVAQGRFSVNRCVELVSTTPAKLFGLYPRKGTIATGSDADLVIFDPERKHTISAKTHHMRVDYSMFEGIEVRGMPDQVLSRGRMIVDRDEFLGRAGSGEFLRRSTYSQP
ncbi:MAG: dihydropyrimidinase [Acidobacteria bacterium]|nr:MAG: dihydropyrimidinase [Acidobacteriota bacterium]PYY08200.1 MAG: dihydropyrimidinase [Acidobacteriota bacterium]